MTTSKKTKPPAISDSATVYAQEVTQGKRVAGPHVRAQCERHLRDLKAGKQRGLKWDAEKAEKAIGFFADVLKLNGGDFEGKPFILLPWQCFVVGSLFGWQGVDGYRRFRSAYIETAKGPLALDTPIATPSGWTTMGDIQPGDFVFDDYGKPTKVTEVSPVFHNHDCFRLTFSDGVEIVADAEHRWNTAALRSGRRPGPHKDGAAKGCYGKRTTAEIASTLRMPVSASVHSQAKWNHRVDVADMLDLPDVYLPIPCYTLGAWLGDGDSDSARLTVAYAEWQIVEEIISDGISAVERVKHSETTARVLLGSAGRSQVARDASLQTRLRNIGVIGNKHIPDAYFRAGTGQRLALLQGLMDTDGTISPGGKCEITLCNERLSRDTLALIRTLGFKADIRESDAKLNGRVVGRRWRICFQAYKSLPPFRLTRKRERLNDEPKTRALSRGRMIVGCELVASVPVRCITVEAESHMFLAGTGLVPTCNSGKSPLAGAIGILGLVADNEPRAEIYSAATKKDQAMILFRDAVAMVDQSPELKKRLQKSGTGERCWNLAYMAQGAFFRPISSDDGQSGPRPHIGLIDELHEHKTNAVVEMMRAGTKSRRQAMIFMITNAGHNRMGPCWGYHEYGAKVASGEVEDDAFFPYICSLDQERIEEYKGEKAVRHMVKYCSCNVQTILTDLLVHEDSARVALLNSISNAISMPVEDALTTQIGQWLREACAIAATKHGYELTVQPLKRSRTLEQKDGQTPIRSVSENIKRDGLKSRVLNTSKNGEGRISSQSSGSANNSSTNYKQPKKDSAGFADVNQVMTGLSRLITAMTAVPQEDSFAINAMLESVCLAIQKKLFDAHSTTCKIHQLSSFSGPSLKANFPADDPFKDEACWLKANPSLQDADLPGMKYIREQVVEAKGMPSKESIVRRLNFCQWTDAESPWISGEVWRGAQLDFDWRDLRGRRAFAGLDLSSTTDLTGMVFLVEPESEGEPWLLVPFAWLPDVDLQRKADTDRVPYIQWRAEGILDTTPGRAISKRVVLQKLSAMSEFFDVVCVGYDRWRIEDLIAMASDEGITLPEMKPVGQGYRDFSPAIETFERMLLNGEIAHPGHKVLDWCMSNAVIEQDGAENRKLSKDKATGRIDLAVAAVMAAGLINIPKAVTMPEDYELFTV